MAKKRFFSFLQLTCYIPQALFATSLGLWFRTFQSWFKPQTQDQGPSPESPGLIKGRLKIRNTKRSWCREVSVVKEVLLKFREILFKLVLKSKVTKTKRQFFCPLQQKSTDLWGGRIKSFTEIEYVFISLFSCLSSASGNRSHSPSMVCYWLYAVIVCLKAIAFLHVSLVDAKVHPKGMEIKSLKLCGKLFGHNELNLLCPMPHFSRFKSEQEST